MERMTSVLSSDRAKKSAYRQRMEALAEREANHTQHSLIIQVEPGRSRPTAPSVKKDNKHILVQFGIQVSHDLVDSVPVTKSGVLGSILCSGKDLVFCNTLISFESRR